MPHQEADLTIVEVPYESGTVKQRFAVVLSADSSNWVRHGLFVAYSEAGVVVSEGNYVQGKEQGLWRDFHPNGKLAAEGQYANGEEQGAWRFWDENGVEEQPTVYEGGRERAA